MNLAQAVFCKQGFSSLTCNRRPPEAAQPGQGIGPGMLSRVNGQCSCKLKLSLCWKENKGLCSKQARSNGACGFPKARRESRTLLEGDEDGPCPSPLSSAPACPHPTQGWRQGLLFLCLSRRPPWPGHPSPTLRLTSDLPVFLICTMRLFLPCLPHRSV